MKKVKVKFNDGTRSIVIPNPTVVQIKTNKHSFDIGIDDKQIKNLNAAFKRFKKKETI